MLNCKNRILCKYLFIATCIVLVSCKKDESNSDPEAGKKDEWVKISADDHIFGSNIVISGSDFYVGTSLNGAYHSSDQGISWQSINSGLPGMVSIHALTLSGSYLLAATEKGLFRTANKGLNWTAVNSGLPADCEINDFAKLNQDIYIATDKGVYRSSDNGTNWISVNTTALIYYSAGNHTVNQIIEKLEIIDSNIIAFGMLSGICRSSDGGASWTKVSDENFFTSATAVSGKKLFTSWGVGVYRSDDNGANWTLANKGKEFTTTNAFAVSGSYIYSAGSDIFVSSDNGANWVPYNLGMEHVYLEVMGLTISGDYLYATTTDGVWRCLLK